jgi:hypothetical protein
VSGAKLALNLLQSAGGKARLWHEGGFLSRGQGAGKGGESDRKPFHQGEREFRAILMFLFIVHQLINMNQRTFLEYIKTIKQQFHSEFKVIDERFQSDLKVIDWRIQSID